MAFLVRLSDEDVRIRFSGMLELELAEVAFQLALKEKHPKDWRRFRNDGRARRRASRLMADVGEAWAGVLEYFEYVRIPVDDVLPDVGQLMARCGLASYDAVHAATALMPGSVGIVTKDAGFSGLPEATAIYTDATRVAACRARRSR